MSREESTMVIDQGPFFPSTMRVLFYFWGTVLSITIIGLPLGLPLLAMAMYRVGTQIDTEYLRVREYGLVFGLTRGDKWQALSTFKAIVILGNRRVSTMYSRGQVALDDVQRNHDVTLVNATHRKKFLLKACDSVEDARSLAEKVAQLTGLPIQRYAPQQISTSRR